MARANDFVKRPFSFGVADWLKTLKATEHVIVHSRNFGKTEH